MATNNTITIERTGFGGALVPMHIVINDIQSIYLSNGEHKNITVPIKKEECILQVNDHVFKVANLKQVKKIVLKFSLLGIKCSILYRDGNILDAINKNPGADVTKTILLVILFLILFLILIGFPSTELILWS